MSYYKELLNRIDEEVFSALSFVIVICITKDILLSIVVGIVMYLFVWIISDGKPTEQIEIKVTTKEVKQTQVIPKLKYGEVLISPNFKLNILSDSIFINAIKRFGKSVLLYNMILGIHKEFTPKEVQMVIIDLKKTSMRPFTDSPYVVNNRIYTESHEPPAILLIENMLKQRQNEFIKIDKGILVDNLKKYHRVKADDQPHFPHLLVVIDEIQLFSEADLLRLDTVNKVSGAFGITFIAATQRGVATIPPTMLSQFDIRCVGYQTNRKEYKYANVSDDAIEKMSKTKGLFAIGSDSMGFDVVQTSLVSSEEIEKLALSFPNKSYQLGSAVLENNIMCLNWFKTKTKKPTKDEIRVRFNCDKEQADTFSKLWSKR